VIDRPALIAWRSKAPWPDRVQIEQDLLLSRLMIEIARDEVLGPELAMRGGTLRDNLTAKLANVSFRRDLEALVTNIPPQYDPNAAADIVMRELGSRLRNAPPVEEIAPLRV
jgi:hypothetical protein